MKVLFLFSFLDLSAAQEIMLRRRKKAGKGIEQTDDEKDTAKLDALADELISAGHVSYSILLCS